MNGPTVDELITNLRRFGGKTKVALSKDEEGNGYYENIYPELQNGVVVLYPGGFEKDLEEINGYVYEEEDEQAITS